MFVLGRMESWKKSFFVSSDEFIFDSKRRREKKQGVMTPPQPSPGGREQDSSQDLGVAPKVLPLGEDLVGVYNHISNLP